MRRARIAAVLALLPAVAFAQESPLPKADGKPVLQLDPGGPAAAVTALAFAPDGRTLYVGGLDKAVRVYRLRGGAWAADVPLRVPAGPGNAGAVNALAVSDDGRWLAVAGRGPMRDEAGFAANGVVIPGDRRSDAMRRDLGVIHLFDLTAPAGGRVLRGHTAEIRSLAFAAGSPIPVLLSAAVEPQAGGAEVGVIRVWDTTAGTELAARADYPASRLVRRVAGWATGPGKTDVTVAAAWPDGDGEKPGNLRLWDVGRDRVELKPDGAFNLALAVVRDRAGKVTAIATGGFGPTAAGGKPQGRVTVRPLAGAEPPPIALPFTGTQHQLPLALAPAGERLTALVYRSPPAAGETDRPTDLVMFDSAGAVATRVPLAGVSPEYAPTLAATPAGDWLAVAGFRDNHVELHPVAVPPGQPIILPSGPAGYDRVRFVDGGTAVALTPTGGGNEIAFDFANRGPAPVAGRRPDAPAADGVEFTAVPPAAAGDRYAVRVTPPGRAAVTCRLIPRAVPTTYAYHPGRSLVAVGHDEPGQMKPLITLFDAATGRELRQLTGHTGAVRSLAFSAARPLLASAAADGTVCVWTLKDMDREPGTVDGLAVGERDGRVVVDAVTPALGGRLAVGDVIESVGGGDNPAAVTTAAEFVWRASAVPPGGTLPVRVRGKAGPVALPVTRGVDERKPLFTLWLAAGGREWVGWSPAGPYDASGEDAERRIGWLTNTGDPKTPTTFAAAGEYRDATFRKELLRFLAAEADLAAAADAWQDTAAPPPPRLTVIVPEKTDGVVRFGKATLRVAVGNVRPDYPMDRAELKYRVRPPGAGDPARGAAPRPADGEFNLSDIPWVRGWYAVEARLYGRPGGPVVDDEAEQFLAAPPAPTFNAITADGMDVQEGVEIKVAKPTVRIALKAAGYDDEPVTVTVNGKEVNGPIDLPLQSGANTVVLRAVAGKATDDTRDVETTEVTFTVRYDPPAREPAPAVGPLEFTPAGEPRRFRDADVIAVASPTVTVTAQVTAAHPLTAAGIAIDTDPPAADEAAAGKKAAVVRRELALKPGEPVRVTASAASANSDPGRQSAVIVYLPPVAEVTVNPLARPEVYAPKLTVTGTAAGPATVRLTVSSPADPGRGMRPVEVKVGQAGPWSAEVELVPGPNRIAMTAANDWRERQLPVGIAVAYRRRPVIVTPIQPADAGANGVADVTLTVESPAGLPLTDMEVDGRPVANPESKPLAPAGGLARWAVTARAVPVNTADGRRETLTVRVRNEEAWSDPATAAVIRAATPPPPRPTVTLMDVPAEGSTTTAETILVRILARSPVPVDGIELLHTADREKWTTTVQPGAPTGEADGWTTVEAKAEVRLVKGPNTVQVTARNAGGSGTARFVVNRLVPPVLIEVEGLDDVRPGAAGRPLAPLAGPELRFEPAAGGVVAVRGLVRWTGPLPPEAADPGLVLSAAVNQVAHLPIPLGPLEGGVRRFHAPLFLNQSSNVVRLEVRQPSGRLPHDRAGRRELSVGSADPLKRQRLHVVVLAVGDVGATPAELAARVVRVLGGPAQHPRFDHGPFQAPGFEHAMLYQPRVGAVDRGKVLQTLNTVAVRVRELADDRKDKWVNDVVLVYYRGQDWVDPRDGRRWLHTSDSLGFRDTPAAWPDLGVAVDELPATAGVRLLVLNVIDPGGPAAPARDPGVPVFRYPWANPAGQARLLTLFERALAAKWRLGDVIDFTLDEHRQAQGAGESHAPVADDLRNRPIGRGKP